MLMLIGWAAPTNVHGMHLGGMGNEVQTAWSEEYAYYIIFAYDLRRSTPLQYVVNNKMGRQQTYYCQALVRSRG